MSSFFIELLKKWFPKENKPDPNNPRNGLLPSPFDARDLQAKDVLGAIDLAPLPENYRIPYILPIHNQGSEPSCVGWSCAAIKNEKERREQNETDFDGLWIYQQAKLVDGIPDIKGTYFRTGLKILRDVGAKPLPTSAVQSVPETFKISSYAQVECNFESLKRAIIANGAILAGYYGDDAGWASAYIKPPKSIQWGHAVAIIGWKVISGVEYLIIQNSWGADHGDGGYYYADKNTLPFEAWTVLSDVPTVIREVEKPVYTFTKNLFRGMYDADVIQLQRFYKWNGCMAVDVPESQNFGNQTFNATKIYQQRKGLPQTGNVFELTRAKINEDLK